MDMNMLQGLVQQQKLILTTEMQQSLKILQMPIFDLQRDIIRELEENPLLETVQEERSKDEKEYSDTNEDIDYKQLVKEKEIINYDNLNYNKDDNDKVDPLNFVIEKKTLKDYLAEQVIDLKEDDEIIDICNYIIESIDERGYLSCRVEEISEDLKVSIEQVEWALNLVQSFHPWGVAARDLKECLKIQLAKKHICDDKVFTLIDDCLELIAENKLKEIGKRLNLDVTKVQEYCNIIKSLEPKPSRGFYTGNIENYVIPEAYIKKIGNDLYILMNESALPRLTVNHLYKDIIKQQENGQALDYVKGKLNSAVYLIKGIEQRNRTIYNILEKIVEVQKEYFDLGEQHLKPMTIGDIASKLSIHESTVSRAIKDKYICTPFSTIKIKDLFTTGIESNLSNENVSSNLIKKEIKKLIDGEKKSKPLSDQDISNQLKDMKIEVSRRTVAKYREEMGISSSSKRKVY
jgi:RNA polymerase sigma-54 factor